MPATHKNVNVSIAIEGQLPFLQHLAKKDRGEMSRYIRGLIEADPAYLAWRGVPDTSELAKLREENKKLREAIAETNEMYNPSDLSDPWC
ncbi:hypothetical protein M0R72_19465 [Candidatus Pacearchaeota archaeon]|jgi:hypothetical protein|nr:hypothetical protein [Candidatus Pacearchaeota archaeon]